MESRTIKLLEFPKILKYLSQEAVSIPGRDACLQIRPLIRSAELQSEQRLLQQACKILKEHSLKPDTFPELEQVLALIQREEAVLDNEGLWFLHSFLDSAARFLSELEKLDASAFSAIREALDIKQWPEMLWTGLNRCLGPAGDIKDQSSPELMAVRGDIRSLREQCSKKINESLSQVNVSHYLQDEYLTISSDRYVLALKSNFKGKLQGIIHDYSQSGETCYFEPLFLVDLNNRLQGLYRVQKEEEKKVRAYLTGLARRHQEEVRSVYAWLVSMDVIWAKARLAEIMSGTVLPITGDSLELKNVRHPLLVLGGHRAVPVDISLNPGHQALVISGGNAGGKTVSLKSLGLTALMALCALPVPVDEGSSIPFWDKIFVSMVSEQSVEESLSTFTAQIEHFSRFWPQVDRSTLVILDEFGVGTDPSQGAALAQAVVDSLLDKKAWIATATHFPSLKAYALSREDVRAASVLFDPETKKPLYKLAYDQVGASQALKVAREQGLPGEIIDRAQDYLLLEDEKQSRLFDRLNDLAAQREDELSGLRKERARLETQLEKEREKFVREQSKLLVELKRQSQEIVRQWQKEKIGRKHALKKLSQLRRQAESLAGISAVQEGRKDLCFYDILPDKRYFYSDWNKTGIVRDKDHRKKQVKIDFGGISIWIDPQKLERPPGNAGSITFSGHTSSMAGGQIKPYSLDLRGKYTEDALLELDKFLDQSVVTGKKTVEIIHGKGTGLLKKAVREHLQQSLQVKDYSSGSEEGGDDGMTTVELV